MSMQGRPRRRRRRRRLVLQSRPRRALRRELSLPPASPLESILRRRRRRRRMVLRCLLPQASLQCVPSPEPPQEVVLRRGLGQPLAGWIKDRLSQPPRALTKPSRWLVVVLGLL